MNVDIVLVGGPQDGWLFALPPNERVVRSGELVLAVAAVPSLDPDAPPTRFERYRWDGSLSWAGARRYVRETP